MSRFCHYAILASLLAVSTCTVGLPMSATDRYYIRRKPEHLFDTVVVDEAVELCKQELSKDYLTGSGSGKDKPWKWQKTESGDAYFILKSDLKDLSVGANCLFLTSLEIMARRMALEAAAATAAASTDESYGGLQDQPPSSLPPAPSPRDHFA